MIDDWADRRDRGKYATQQFNRVATNFHQGGSHVSADAFQHAVRTRDFVTGKATWQAQLRNEIDLENVHAQSKSLSGLRVEGMHAHCLQALIRLIRSL
jgi:hypothetical protein